MTAKRTAAKRAAKKTASAKPSNGAKVALGDSVEIDGDGHGYVVLPDGAVTTARASYVVRHEGEHRIGDRTFVGVKAEEEHGDE